MNKTIKKFIKAAMLLLVMLLTATTAWAEAIQTYYIDADGTRHDVTATVLTGSETSLGSEDNETWYVVNSNINHANTIECKGNVILILADDCTMTASAGINIAENYTLNIYSQQGDGGILTINCMPVSEGIDGGNGINGDVIVNGGTINITGGNGGNGEVLVDISLYHWNGNVGGMGINGSLTVNGGTMNITGGQGGQGYQNFHTENFDFDGGEGGMGGYGIKGPLTVNGGTINITGGAGGKGGDKNGRASDPTKGGNGGNGAEGIKGTLTVNGGFITINGGNGGEGGKGIRGIGAGSPGSAGHAVDGTVTFDAETTLMEESDDQSTWSNLTSGSTSTKRYIRTGVPVALELYDDASNTETIADNKGRFANVTLTGRTLSKSGEWNTLCLPFSVTAAQMAETTHPLYGATIKELDNSASGTNLDDEGALTLKFNTVYDGSTYTGNLVAGKPYIVKWENTTGSVSNPVFSGVAISSTSPTEVTSTADEGKVKFVGQYSPFSITDQNKVEIVYIASGNKIGYSKSARTLKSFRAHFWVKSNGAQARAINVDWGDDATAMPSIDNGQLIMDNEAGAQWYDLSGRRLIGKPTQKGVYINNGRKVVIK